jgi:hypothetical protein
MGKLTLIAFGALLAASQEAAFTGTASRLEGPVDSVNARLAAAKFASSSMSAAKGRDTRDPRCAARLHSRTS